jgi:phospholipase C
MDTRIQHVVVLMLENRSFDSMLGRLYPPDASFNGLTLNESNQYGMTYGVWNDPKLTPAMACIPDPDPGELFEDMNVQLFGNRDRTGKTADMSGFALDYALPVEQPASYRDPGAVMHYFIDTQVPVISSLARAFAVCDDWHASAPCQTWPNRFFAHTGTALGYVDNKSFKLPFEAPSLFRRLEDKGKDWRVYFHDMPQSLLLRDVWIYALSHFRYFSQFLADAYCGVLPAYSFIEPQYFTDLCSNRIPNDEHPPHNVLYGEQLIAQVYNAVRSSRCWKSTLLIITCDEHGGCYDHVPPPEAVPPEVIRPNTPLNNKYNFRFDAYGVRVPAVLVSPWIAPGKKIRAPGWAAKSDARAGPPFDHTSIIRTVREIFDLGDELTDRDAAAPSLMPALSLAAANNDGPPSVTAELGEPPKPSVFVARGGATPNPMQAALAAAAASLPANVPAIESQILPSAAPDRPSFKTVATAQAAATDSVKSFLGL